MTAAMTVAERIHCAACGRLNPADALFCARCIAPLRVARLAELEHDDFRVCAQALADVLGPLRAAAAPPLAPPDAELLSAYLEMYWLRPETALWQTLDARAVRALLPAGLHPPRLDLGCGDGTHTALLCGTRFDERFDAYAALDLTAADIFDAHSDADWRPRIVRRGTPIELAVDIRENMVRRAAALGAHRRVLRADAAALPLADASVGTVYSNILRDLPDDTCEAALAEVARVLRPDGRLILPAPTPHWRQALYFHPRAVRHDAQGRRNDAERFTRLDRGRSVSFAQQIDRSAWERRLARAGLEIIDVRPTHSAAVVRFWDVGLRPFAVPLLRFVARLDPTARLLVKRSVCAVLMPILARFLAVAVPADPVAHTMYLVARGSRGAPRP